MEEVRFWLEGVWLWLDERRRAVGIAVGAGVTIGTLVLLGSTVAAPLLSGAPRTSPASTQAVAVSHAAPAARAHHQHAQHRSGESGHGQPASYPGRSSGGYTGGSGSDSHHGHGNHHSSSPPKSRGPFAPSGRILHGVSDTTRYSDFKIFTKQVGAHPSVLEDFYHWDTPLTTGALQRWHRWHTRGVLSLSTAPGGGPELITPRQIANGTDDHYLLRLQQSISTSKQVVYLRLFPEMNGYWNPYSAFNQDGSRRDSAHSPKSFRRAWQRVSLIVRGGKRSAINHALVKRGMPRILDAKSNHASVYDTEGVARQLTRPKVAFVWTPLAIGSPNVKGNRPSAYWPGKAFVDWIGTDLYSKYDSGSMRAAVTKLYRRYKLPFAIGEYSPWNKDPKGRYTRHVFRWAEGHRRVGMLIYYRSVTTQTHFSLDNWPAAKRVIKHQLNKPRFAR